MLERPRDEELPAQHVGAAFPKVGGEEVFPQLFERSSDAVVLLDPISASFIDCNQAALTMLRAKCKEQVLALNAWQISPEYQLDGVRSEEKSHEVHEAMQRGTTRFEWMHLRLDGTELPVEVLLTEVLIRERRLWVAMWRDITERKRQESALRESEDKFRLLFERSSDAILLLDSRHLKFIDCNQATLELLRARSKDEVLDTHPWKLSPERQPNGMLSIDKANLMIQAVVEKGTHRFEWVHRRMDGSDFPVEVVLTAVQIGDRPLVVTVWREITERKRFEEALRASENKFRLLFERAIDPMLLLDLRTWEFLDCNQAALNITGYSSKAELFAHPLLLSPEFQPDGRRSIDWINETREYVRIHGSRRFEWTHRRVDGTEFPVEVTLTAIEELSDAPVVLTVWRDISRWKRAEAEIRELNVSLERRVRDRTAALIAAQETLRMSEERFRLSFEHTVDPIILLDVNTGSFVEANDAAMRFYGASTMNQLLASQPWDVSPEVQPDGRFSEDAAREHIELAKARGAHRFEWLHRRFDGSEFPAEVSLTVVQFSDMPLMVAVLHDLTERKLAEAELVKNLAKARELSDLKSSFVSMVSHEFRTPLAVILSCAELLKNHLDRLPADTREQQLRAICESTQHMSKMIDEVLLLGKVEAGQMRFAPAEFSLSDFCARLVDEMLSATQRRCVIELHAAEMEGPAAGDEALLRHIIGNLLSNAVKYSPAGEVVRLDVQREDTNAILTISDKGVGIPEADMPKIFQAFHRASNVGQIAGTGLGLVIVQRCVELHGGKISLESEVGAGTRVHVRLPLFANRATSSAPNPEMRE